MTQYKMGQILVGALRAGYQLVVANTGAYKQRQSFQCLPDGKERPLTDDEKLTKTLQIAHLYIQRVESLCEELSSEG